MDTYKLVISRIEKQLIKEGKSDQTKYVDKICDRYLSMCMTSLFNKGVINTRINEGFYIKAYPIAYLTKGLARRVVFSSRYPRMTFKIHYKSDDMKEHKFSFRALPKMNNKFKKEMLDTENVYSLIQLYEKGILQKRISKFV